MEPLFTLQDLMKATDAICQRVQAAKNAPDSGIELSSAEHEETDQAASKVRYTIFLVDYLHQLTP